MTINSVVRLPLLNPVSYPHLSRIELDPERQDEHRTQVYESLAHIAEARGQYKQALVYERLSNQYGNAMQSVEKNRQLAEVEARYQTAQKQASINQLSICLLYTSRCV